MVRLCRQNLQAPPSLGFSRQEYWSGLPLLSPGNFPTQGSNPGLPHCRQMLYHLSQQGSPQFNSWVRKMLWRRDRLPTPVFLGFPSGSAGKESSCNAGDLGFIPGLERCPGEGIGYPLQYSWASFVAQLVKNLPAMWEIWV